MSRISSDNRSKNWRNQLFCCETILVNLIFCTRVIHRNFFVRRNEKYGGTKDDHLILKKRSDNRLCDQLKNEELNQLDDQTKQQSSPNSDYRERFQIDIKTGRSRFSSSSFFVLRISSRSHGISGFGWCWN